MTEPDFDFVRKLLQGAAAIALKPAREYLVETRLAVVVRD